MQSPAIPKSQRRLDRVTIAVFIAALAAGSFISVQPHARAIGDVRGLPEDAYGWPFVSTSYSAFASSNYLLFGELANILVVGTLVACVFYMTLKLVRWNGRISVQGMLLLVTTVCVACTVLLGRWDEPGYRACRAIGLVPTDVDGFNIWITYARISLVYCLCVAMVWCIRSFVLGCRRRVAPAMVD
jgi:hypothetical protein